MDSTLVDTLRTSGPRQLNARSPHLTNNASRKILHKPPDSALSPRHLNREKMPPNTLGTRSGTMLRQILRLTLITHHSRILLQSAVSLSNKTGALRECQYIDTEIIVLLLESDTERPYISANSAT